MRIGILTFHNALNYGAVLQAFALKTALEQMGQSPIILNYFHELPLWKRLYIDFKAPDLYKSKYWKLFKDNAKEYLSPISPKLTGKNVKSYAINNLDAIIVGSDQVWRLEFSHIGLGYFLDFCEGTSVKKISYAASFGYNNWEADSIITQRINNLLKQFNAISVREASGVKICNEVFNTHAVHVLDPTLLHDVDIYKKSFKIENCKNISRRFVSYLLGSFSNQKYYKYFNNLAKERNIIYTDLYYTSSHVDESIGETRKYHLTPCEWLASIESAEYVVTNSFHATVFAILFRKKFLVLESSDHRSSRLGSLLESLDLVNRLVTIADVSYAKFEEPIEYESVLSKIMKLRMHSIDFLKDNLQ